MPNIKEIALKISHEMQLATELVMGDYNKGVTDFAEALIAELAKGNEPVEFTNSCELDYLDFKRADSGLVSAAIWKDYDKDSDIALYTFQPTASQIEQETAEVELLREDKCSLYQNYEQQRKQLAIAEAQNARLREALEQVVNGADECLDDDGWIAMVISMEAYHICDEAISLPSSRETLDAYVAEKVKEIEAELETERLRLAACGVAALGYFNGCRDEYRSASLDDTLRLYAKYEAITQQRDLAVEALEKVADDGGNRLQYEAVVALSAIKESEVK